MGKVAELHDWGLLVLSHAEMKDGLVVFPLREVYMTRSPDLIVQIVFAPVMDIDVNLLCYTFVLRIHFDRLVIG